MAHLRPSSAHLLDLGDEEEILPCFSPPTWPWKAAPGCWMDIVKTNVHSQVV